MGYLLPDASGSLPLVDSSGWNSNHDNGFTWLVLIQALAFPILLCSTDARLSSALRRSLKSSAEISYYHHHQMLAGQPMTCSPSIGCKFSDLAQGLSADRQRKLSTSAGDFALDPAAAYQDFLLVGPARQANGHKRPVSAVGGRRWSAPGTRQQEFGALTGPPYAMVSIKQQTHRQPLVIDTQGSLSTNFTLVTKGEGRLLSSANQRGLRRGGCTVVGTADLMASRRARYGELRALKSKAGELASGKKSRRQLRNRTGESGRSGAILNATKLLFRLGKTTSRRGGSRPRARNNSPGGPLIGTSDSVGSGTAGSQHGKSGGMSPTSSLSTLIRKFNHENYTNVCQLYEQQRILRENVRPEEVLIQGLDEPAKPSEKTSNNSSQIHAMNEQQSPSEADPAAEGVLCRKGGLYYNYPLDDDHSTESDSNRLARVNPMLSSGQILLEVSPEEQSESPICGAQSRESNGDHKATTKTTDIGQSADERLVKSGDKIGKETNGGTISNIKSVQELLDRVNGDASSISGTPIGRMEYEEQAPSSSFEVVVVSHQSGSQAVEKRLNNDNDNHKQTSLSNQLRQLNAIVATCDYDDDFETTIAKSSRDHKRQRLTSPNGLFNHDAGQQTDSRKRNLQRLPKHHNQLQQAPASAAISFDYSTLRSVDDALSLVSVSSEFEYHNIDSGPSQLTRRPPVGAAPQSPPDGDCGQNAATKTPPQQRSRRVPETEYHCLDGSSAAVETLGEDLRFPTFFASGPTEAQTNVGGQSSAAHKSQVAKTSGPNHQVRRDAGRAGERDAAPRPSGQRDRGAFKSSLPTLIGDASDRSKSSSCLLNLTNAKFAAMSSSRQSSHVRQRSGKPAAGSQQRLSWSNNGHLRNQSHAKLNKLNSASSRQLPQRVATSSHVAAPVPSVCAPSATITKQKALVRPANEDHASDGQNLIRFGEFGSRPSQIGAGARRADGSLPAQSGNVRAQIRKMESQQSSADDVSRPPAAQAKQQVARVSSSGHLNRQQQIKVESACAKSSFKSLLPTPASGRSRAT